MSHFHDEYFEARLNAVQADEDASEAYYRQKEIDEAEEAEYKAMCDADEAAHDWLDAEIEMANIKTPQDAEEMFRSAIAAQKKALERLKSFDKELREISENMAAIADEIKDLKGSMTEEELQTLRSYLVTPKNKAA